MLSPYDWALTVRVLYHLARLWPQLKQPAAPHHAVPDHLVPLARRGPYEVQVKDFAWGRAAAPLQAPPAPVILFSGGAAADGTGYEQLADHWASHGYCVLQCVHRDAFQKHLERTGSQFWGTVGVVWYIWGLVLGDHEPWRARVEDLTGLIDQLPAVSQQLGVALMPERVGVAGYSYGGQAALLAAGAAHFSRGRLHLWRDERIRAALAISPEPGARTLPYKVWQSLTTPFMVLTGSQDGDVLGRDWRPKAEAVRRAPAAVRELCVIPGANHFALSGRLLENAIEEEDIRAQQAIFAAVRGQSLNFWRQYLPPC